MTELDLIIADSEGLQAGSVVVLGLPWDADSSHVEGAAQAPQHIRRALQSPSGNPYSESGLCLQDGDRCRVLGDLSMGSDRRCFERVTELTGILLDRQLSPLFLGGDHSVTQAVLKAYEEPFERLTVVQFDAHPDLYPEFGGNPFSHASVMSRVLERGTVDRLIQVGVRADTPEQSEVAHRYRVERVTVQPGRPFGWAELEIEGPIYVSLDLDVLDPAFAPGVSHPEHGGLSSRDLIQLIQTLPATIVGADLVELNPTRDFNGLSAGLAAKLVKEMVARMIGDGVG